MTGEVVEVVVSGVVGAVVIGVVGAVSGVVGAEVRHSSMSSHSPVMEFILRPDD